MERVQSLNARSVAERASRRKKLVVSQVEVLRQELAAAHAKITSLLDERSRESRRANKAESVAANLRERLVAVEGRVAELLAAKEVSAPTRHRALEERAAGSESGAEAEAPAAQPPLPNTPFDDAVRWEARRSLKAVEADAARRIGAAQRDAVVALERERERAARERERDAAERERIAAQLRRADASRLAERRGRARNDVVLHLANSSLKTRLRVSRDDLVAARGELVASHNGAAIVALGEARLEQRLRAVEHERELARERDAAEDAQRALVDARAAIGGVKRRLQVALQRGVAAPAAAAPRTAPRAPLSASPTVPPAAERASTRIEAALLQACDELNEHALRVALVDAQRWGYRSKTSLMASMLLRELGSSGRTLRANPARRRLVQQQLAVQARVDRTDTHHSFRGRKFLPRGTGS